MPMNLKSFALVLLLPALATAGSTVQLRKDTTNLALPQVRAVKFVPNSGPARIHLLFTDKEPEAGVVVVDEFGDTGFSLPMWARNSGSAAMTFEYAEGDPANFSHNTYNIGDENLALGGHVSGDGVEGVFKTLSVKDGTIAGVLQYDGPAGAVSGNFEAPLEIIKEPAVVTGPQVGKSEPGRVLLSFVKALTKFDFKTAETFSANPLVAELTELRKTQGDAAFKAMLKEEFGDPKELEGQLNAADAQMAMGAQSAKVWVKRPGHESPSRFGLKKANGKWGVNW